MYNKRIQQMVYQARLIKSKEIADDILYNIKELISASNILEEIDLLEQRIKFIISLGL